MSLISPPRPSADPSRPHEGSVALVHDYLNQRGGAERVVLNMANIWPEAPIYTSLYRAGSTFEGFRDRTIHTSWMQELPVDRRFRTLMPLFPSAFRQLGTIDADVVISSSSGWAHGIRTTPDSRHLVYCHAPARWLYSGQEYLGRRRSRATHALLDPMRRWDKRAARRADCYLANAYNVADRIRRAYGIESRVVHPPVDVDRFMPRPRGERLLVVSRLLPYKRLDLAIEAAARLDIGLDVVGDGPELQRLQALAGRRTVFHGQLSDEAVVELMENCSAFLFPGREDFGIAPVEANAAGKPVVAFAAGGALETLQDGVTSAFFASQSVKDVMAAIRRVYDIDTSPERIAENAHRFSPQAFERNLRRAIAETPPPMTAST
jgi:glycosyltransferase involved in cell wall biosynthesis